MEVVTQASPDRLRELVATGTPFWLDFEGREPELRARLINELVPEGAAHPGVIAFGAHPAARPAGGVVALACVGMAGDEPVEVHLYVTPSSVVSARAAALPAVTQLYQQASKVHTAPAVAALVLDSLADSFGAFLYARDDRLTALESVAAGGEPSLRRDLLAERAPVVRLARTARRQARAVERGVEEIEGIAGTGRAARAALKDAAGRALRAADDLEDAVARVGSALDIHDSAVASRTNQIMERLTVVATIFLPLTAVTGFFAMNFSTLEHHIESPLAFWGLGVGAIAASGLAIWVWIKGRLEREPPAS